MLVGWLMSNGISTLVCYLMANLVRAKVKYCKLLDHFGCWVIDCSATRNPSWCMTARYPCPTSGSIRRSRGLAPQQKFKGRILQLQLTGLINFRWLRQWLFLIFYGWQKCMHIYIYIYIYISMVSPSFSGSIRIAIISRQLLFLLHFSWT